jgi:hypothetical protein
MLVATRKADQNFAVLDPWSTVHFGVGMAAGLTGVPWWAALGAAVGYELSEQAFEKSEWGQRLFATSGPEAWPNAVADVVIYMGAWWLGSRYHAAR